MPTFTQDAQPSVSTAQYKNVPQNLNPIPTRTPISGYPTRGTIINAPEVDDCAVDSVKISYQTILKIALGGAKGDIPVVFDFPVRKIWVASKDGAHLSDSLYFHLSRLGKTYPGGNSIVPVGNENWFDITLYAVSGQVFLGKVIEFAKPISRGFLDIGQEAGGTDYFITIAGSNDVISVAANQIGVTAS